MRRGALAGLGIGVLVLTVPTAEAQRPVPTLTSPSWVMAASRSPTLHVAIEGGLADRRVESPFTTIFYNDPVRYTASDRAAGVELPETRPVWEIPPESLIVSPAGGSRVDDLEVEIWGWAWAHGVDPRDGAARQDARRGAAAPRADRLIR